MQWIVLGGVILSGLYSACLVVLVTAMVDDDSGRDWAFLLYAAPCLAISGAGIWLWRARMRTLDRPLIDSSE